MNSTNARYEMLKTSSFGFESLKNNARIDIFSGQGVGTYGNYCLGEPGIREILGPKKWVAIDISQSKTEHFQMPSYELFRAR